MAKGRSARARLIRVLFFTVVLTLTAIIFQIQGDAGERWVVGTGICEAALKTKKGGKEPAEVGISVQISAPRFEIDGARGFYRETKPGYCLVRATGPAWVEFSADPLYSLTGGKKTKLNVVYWVDRPEKEAWSFRPGGPPLVLPLTGDAQRFTIYGGVTINEVSEQPAGEYRGSITATVVSH